MLISRKALIPKLEALVNLTKSMDSETLQRAIRNSLSMAKDFSPRKAVWCFARYIAAIGRRAHVSRANAKRFFRVWYREACYLREMASFRECWLDFWQAIPKVKYPAGVCLESLYRKAHGDGIERLESLVQIIARYHGDSFALSSGALATVFGVHQTTMSRWIRELVSRGVLVVSQDYSFTGAAAREYRLKALEKQSFAADALHAVVVDETRTVERSVDVHTEPEKAFLEGENVDWLERLRVLTAKRRREMGIE